MIFKRKNKENFHFFTALLLIICLSCQAVPIARSTTANTEYEVNIEREILPPDEAILKELEEASELARTMRGKLITEGIPNFSYNDWQIANTLYEQAVQMEKTTTIRETQESIARYQLTASVLEILYLSATNEIPMGGGEFTEEDFMIFFYDDYEIAQAPVREPVQTHVSSAVPPAQTAAAEVNVNSEELREPGRGLYIPDAPTREERRVEAMIAAGIDPEDIIIPDTPADAPPITRETHELLAQALPPVIPETETYIEQQFFIEIPAAEQTHITVPAVPAEPVRTASAETVSSGHTQPTATPSSTSSTSTSSSSSSSTSSSSGQPYTAPSSATTTAVTQQRGNYPAQYRVISWQIYRDCLWNIAQRVYNDPGKWTLIYEANKHRLPNPNNPNYLTPGMVLDIPSIAGEARVGIWDATMGPALISVNITIRKDDDEDEV